LFPNEEPILLSEEAAIAGVKRGVEAGQSGVQRLRDLTSGDIDADTLLTPRQSSLVSRFTEGTDTIPRTRAETEGPSAPTAEFREELGSRSAEIADVLSGVDVEQPASRVSTETEVDQTPTIRDFVVQERAQGTLLPPSRTTVETETEQTTQPEVDFEPSRSEILEGGPRDIASQEMTARQKELRRQAEGTFEGDIDPLAETERRTEQAQEQRVTTETETETESETFRTELPAQDTITTPEVATEVRTQPLTRPRVEPLVDRREAFDTDGRTATGLDTRQQSGLDVEQRQGTEIDQRQGTEIETVQEVDQEQEIETELETETETEVEQEVESEFFDERDGEDDRLADVLSEIDQTYGTGIATVEELLED